MINHITIETIMLLSSYHYHSLPSYYCLNHMKSFPPVFRTTSEASTWSVQQNPKSSSVA